MNLNKSNKALNYVIMYHKQTTNKSCTNFIFFIHKQFLCIYMYIHTYTRLLHH